MSVHPRGAAAPATAAAGATAGEAGVAAGTAGGGAPPDAHPPLPNGAAGGVADGDGPAPYPHQVGGHGAMVSMGGRLLKPLSRKELAFYTHLWDDAATEPALRWLRAATPRFYGVYRPPAARGTAAAAVNAATAAVAAVGLTPEASPGGVRAVRAAAAAAAATEVAKAATGGVSPASAAAAAAPAAIAAVSTGGVPAADQDVTAAAAASIAASSTAAAAADDEAVSAAAAGVRTTPSPAPRAPLTWDSDVAAMASSAMASSANPDVAPGQLVDDSPAAREAAAAAVAAAREEVELGPAARLRRAVRVATISPWAERMQALAARREAAAAAAAAAEAADAAAGRGGGRGGGGDDTSDGGGGTSVGGTSSSTSPRLPTTGVAATDALLPSAGFDTADASTEQPARTPRVSPDMDPTGSLVMEDLVASYTYPCIMDIKVGIRHYDDDASAEKRARHIRKAAATTSATVGIRVTGSQVYKATRGTLLFRDKYHGRRLREPQLAGELAHFFHDGAALRRPALAEIIGRLKALLAHVEEQRTFNFYSSSILLIYEGDESGAGAGRVVPPLPPPAGNGHAGGADDGGDDAPLTAAPIHTDVRMIDFAHTQPSRGAMDEGYALGLRNLVFLLETVYRDNTAPA